MTSICGAVKEKAAECDDTTGKLTYLSFLSVLIAMEDTPTFEALERKLAYEDIRFYRSIARSELRKDLALRKKLEDEKKVQETRSSTSWTDWIWGASSSTNTQTEENNNNFHGTLSDE